MPRHLPDLLLYISYAMFLLGASTSFRKSGSEKAILLMTSAIIFDILTSILFAKVRFLSGLTTENLVIASLLFFGVIFVWIIYPAALFFRTRKKMRIFHGIILTIEICWFINIVLFVYGMYRFSIS